MTQNLQPRNEITVDDQNYVVQLYSPTYGLELYAKLLRLLGQPVVKLIGSLKGIDFSKPAGLLDFDLADLDTDAAGEALQALFANLKDDEFVPLIKSILSQTYNSPSLDPVSARFETQFAGKYLHLFKLTAKTLGVQYQDFLSGLVKRASVAKLAPVTAKEGKSKG